MTIITCPTDTDVLSGRGNGVNNYPGNVFFREQVKSKKNQYILSPVWMRRKIIKAIIESIQNQNPPGRFLKQHPTNPEVWEELIEGEIIKKLGQALREGAAEIKKQSKNATNDNTMNGKVVVTPFVSPSSSLEKSSTTTGTTIANHMTYTDGRVYGYQNAGGYKYSADITVESSQNIKAQEVRRKSVTFNNPTITTTGMMPSDFSRRCSQLLEQDIIESLLFLGEEEDNNLEQQRHSKDHATTEFNNSLQFSQSFRHMATTPIHDFSFSAVWENLNMDAQNATNDNTMNEKVDVPPFVPAVSFSPSSSLAKKSMDPPQQCNQQENGHHDYSCSQGGVDSTMTKSSESAADTSGGKRKRLSKSSRRDSLNIYEVMGFEERKSKRMMTFRSNNNSGDGDQSTSQAEEMDNTIKQIQHILLENSKKNVLYDVNQNKSLSSIDLSSGDMKSFYSSNTSSNLFKSLTSMWEEV